MRADYGLYVLAIICFIIVGLTISEAVSQYLPELMTFEGTVTTVTFSAIGLIFAILGYALRPKLAISIPEPSKPRAQPTPPVPPPAEETPTSSPLEPVAPTPPQQEDAEPERKKPKTGTGLQRTRKRRKKT